METKRIITGLIAAAVFAGLIACPALARRYDTMMVGPDRWIDIGYLDVHCQKSTEKEVVSNESKNTNVQEIALNQGLDKEPEITYDGQLEPNTVTLIYYPAEENPEHPNSIDFEVVIEPNNLFIFIAPEHPKEPNMINTDEQIEPNDIDRIIHDQGTAYIRTEKKKIAKSS